MILRHTATARAEVSEILSYIAKDNPNAAGRVASAINRTFDWIARWPTASPVVRGPKMRSKLVIGYQYRVFYIVEADEIVVRNVRSTRRLRPWESDPGADR